MNVYLKPWTWFRSVIRIDEKWVTRIEKNWAESIEGGTNEIGEGAQDEPLCDKESNAFL